MRASTRPPGGISVSLRIDSLRKQVDDLVAEQTKVIGQCREMVDKAHGEKRALDSDEKPQYTILSEKAAELKTRVSSLRSQLEMESELSVPSRPAPMADVRSGLQPEPDPSPGATVLGLGKRDRQSYSIVKACRAYGRGRWDEAPLELECHEELEKHFQRQAMGFFVPTEALLIEAPHVGLTDREWERQKEERAIGKVAPTTHGAALVPTDLLSGSFIELLRNRTKVAQMGATILPNLVGDVDIPRQSAAAAVTWIATEGGAAVEDNLETDAVVLTPRTVGVFTDITRRMVKQTSLGIEALVRRDLQASIGVAIDLGAINGSGASGQPTGVLNTSGVGTVTIGTPPVIWADVVNFETDVAAANADFGALGYLITAAIREIFKTVEKAATTAVFLMDPDGMVNGYRTEVSNQLPTGDMIFGNWNDVLIGEWGGLDLLADPYSLGTSGGLRIHGFQDVDVAVRHAASFSVATDVLP